MIRNMNNDLIWCINYLADYNHLERVKKEEPSFNLFRSLMNITLPINPLEQEYFIHQNRVLKDYYTRKTIVDVDSLSPLRKNLYLYKGDITLIKADAIVNAANERMLGCFIPMHNCIDSVIGTFAGLELRQELCQIMKGKDTVNRGTSIITRAYNLPSKYIIHTVGPIVYKNVNKTAELTLRKCYQGIYALAEQYKLNSLVFSAISTGLYGYPKIPATRIAMEETKRFLASPHHLQKIVFDVFDDEYEKIYLDSINKTF